MSKNKNKMNSKSIQEKKEIEVTNNVTEQEYDVTPPKMFSETTEAEENTEKKKTSVIEFIKNHIMYYPLACIGLLAVILMIVCGIQSSSFKSKFITPVSDQVNGQSDKTYVITTYLNETSTNTFVKELKKLEKEYNIPYYLVDLAEYEELVDYWSITYTPTYFVIKYNETTKENELLYKSYGAKKYTILYNEIQYCIENGGIPIDHTGNVSVDSKAYITMTFTGIEASDDGCVATFTIQNTGTSTFTFSNSWVSATSYDGQMIGELSNKKDETTIAAGETETITFTFKNLKPNKITITFDLSSLEETTASKYSWSVSTLEAPTSATTE